MKIDLYEVMRYMGAGADEAMLDAVRKTAEEMEESYEPKYLYRIYDMKKDENCIKICGTEIVLEGETAKRMLGTCDRCAVLLCTLGFGFENELRKLSSRDMSKAFIYDSCGSAYVEYGCDMVEKEIKSAMPENFLTDRFSPGYGDLSLSIQKDILQALNGEKVLGVHLTDSQLFNPTKTVSAIVGISDRPQEARIKGCDYCEFREKCNLRKKGGSCGK